MIGWTNFSAVFATPFEQCLTGNEAKLFWVLGGLITSVPSSHKRYGSTVPRTCLMRSINVAELNCSGRTLNTVVNRVCSIIGDDTNYWCRHPAPRWRGHIDTGFVSIWPQIN